MLFSWLEGSCAHAKRSNLRKMSCHRDQHMTLATLKQPKPKNNSNANSTGTRWRSGIWLIRNTNKSNRTTFIPTMTDYHAPSWRKVAMLHSDENVVLATCHKHEKPQPSTCAYVAGLICSLHDKEQQYRKWISICA